MQSPDEVEKPGASAPEESATDPRAFRWIPVRSLAPRHRPRILAHLLGLEPHDRYLRFGHPAGDAQIGRYVDLLDFERDEVFGVFNRRLELVAMAHLATLDARQGVASAEFGVSVSTHVRGRGMGARLFDHAVLHARNRSVRVLVVHALMENRAMLHIARSAGATIEHTGGEAEARLRLPANDLASHLEEIAEHQVAEIDYGLKLQGRRIDRMIETWSQALQPQDAHPDREGRE